MFGQETPDVGKQEMQRRLVVGKQQKVVHADIALEKVVVTAGEVPGPPDGGMGSLALAAGVAVGNRPPVKVRFQHRAEGVMDNAVAIGGGADGPALGVAHLESEEGTRPVSPRGQVILK